MKYQIVAKTNYQDLTGDGYEARVDNDGNVIALFCCGFMMVQQTKAEKAVLSDLEPTVLLEAA